VVGFTLAGRADFHLVVIKIPDLILARYVTALKIKSAIWRLARTTGSAPDQYHNLPLQL
jgi:hypothetical protein